MAKSATQIFTKVADHLLKEGRVVPVGTAHRQVRRYRTRRGKPVSVGLLIDDQHYHSSFEEVPLTRVNPTNPESEPLKAALVASGVDFEDRRTRELVISLQIIHDRFSPREWPDRLLLLARSYQIDWSPESVSA